MFKSKCEYETTIMYRQLAIESVNFEEKSDWKFYLDSKIINASIEDGYFMQLVIDGGISFSNKTKLYALLSVRYKTIDGIPKSDEKFHYKVLRVQQINQFIMNQEVLINPIETTDGIEWMAKIISVDGVIGGGKTPDEAMNEAITNLQFHLKYL